MSTISYTNITDCNRQRLAYQDFINNFYSTVKWIAFIDSDEFIVVKTQDHRIDKFLNNYEDYGGVALNWLMFGSNGLTNNPLGSRIRAFTKRNLDNLDCCKHIKSIVKAEHVLNAIQGHSYTYKHNKTCVNELKTPINSGPFSPLSYTYANINHYYTGSYNDYMNKIRRGALSTFQGVYTPIHFEAAKLDHNAIEDKTLLNILEKTKTNKFEKYDFSNFYGTKHYADFKEITLDDFYKTIQGWFSDDAVSIYKSQIENAKDGDSFVEVGAWLGRSTAFMATNILKSGKNIKFDVVDTWDDEHYKVHLDIYHDSNNAYDVFMKNMINGNIARLVNPIKAQSVKAAANYENESLDFVFIDGSHDYIDVKNDILAWLPKIKNGAVIAGSCLDWESVKQAVGDTLGIMLNKELKTCWHYVKSLTN